jgi:hypothetical protein
MMKPFCTHFFRLFLPGKAGSTVNSIFFKGFIDPILGGFLNYTKLLL